MQATSPMDRPHAAGQGSLLAFGLALLVHGLLVLALTWGVSWHRQDNSLAVEAELWSAVPQEAAPRAVEPEPQPAPEPPPPPPAPEKVEPPRPSEADIALARERERKEKEAAVQAEQQRQKAERERQEKAEKERQEKTAQAERDRKEKEDKARKQKEQDDKRKEQAANAEHEKFRQEQIRRMQGLAGASGAPSATGTAQQSSGPSSSYAGRIRARVKPNIVFADTVTGNPEATVEVRTSPDGTIIGRKLVKSSGVPNWDDAVLKAIDKTETLPRDTDGTVWTPMLITFRPKD